MRRTTLAIAALALLGLLVIAGCGSGGSSSSSGTSGSGSSGGGEASGSAYGSAKPAAVTTKSKSAPAVVKVMNTPKLGKVIVDAAGMTLYDFHKDKGTKSACYGACAAAWPPLLTKGEPKATGGAKASLLGVTERKDGTEQVTYNGHPLYGFVGDKKPGDTTGNDIDDFGAEWYALEPSGKEPEDS